MCTKEDIQKLDSGKYKLVPTWLDLVKTWIPLPTVAVLLISFGSWTQNYKGRTFENAEQKKTVLDFVGAGHPTNEVLVDDFQDHINDEDIHMSTEEKNAIIIIIENQKKIGGDLAEIKGLLRNRNNSNN